MANFSTYSFLDVSVTIVGPNGVVAVGSSSGTADEGITYSFTEDQSTMTIGADGTGMHSIHGGQSGTVTIRMLMSSPANAMLDAMYAADRAVPSSGGQNTITATWLTGGDVLLATQAAFRKFPDITYGKEGANREWSFTAIRITPMLGAGS